MPHAICITSIESTTSGSRRNAFAQIQWRAGQHFYLFVKECEWRLQLRRHAERSRALCRHWIEEQERTPGCLVKVIYASLAHLLRMLEERR